MNINVYYLNGANIYCIYGTDSMENMHVKSIGYIYDTSVYDSQAQANVPNNKHL